MNITNMNDRYFNWLYETVCGKWEPRSLSFRKLLIFLHSQVFHPACKTDECRAEDGLDLRFRFARQNNIPYPQMLKNFKGALCSMLEMMVALAIRIEEHIMEDSSAGNRVGQWFWTMVVSLGLAAMDDTRFDESRASFIIERFNRRDYKPNGAGGLFTLSYPVEDMRTLDIWYQLMAYLNENEV